MSALSSLFDAAGVRTPQAQRQASAHAVLPEAGHFLATLRQLEGEWGNAFEAAKMRVPVALPMRDASAQFPSSMGPMLVPEMAAALPQRHDVFSVQVPAPQPLAPAQPKGLNGASPRLADGVVAEADRAPGRVQHAFLPAGGAVPNGAAPVSSVERVGGARPGALVRSASARGAVAAAALQPKSAQAAAAQALAACAPPVTGVFAPTAPSPPQRLGMSQNVGVDDVSGKGSALALARAASAAQPQGPSVAVSAVSGGLAIAVWSATGGQALTPALRQSIEDEVARHGCRLARLHVNGKAVTASLTLAKPE